MDMCLEQIEELQEEYMEYVNTDFISMIWDMKKKIHGDNVMK
jgi:hypothetical protein